MKINTLTGSTGSPQASSVRGNTFKLIISLIIPQLAGGLGSFFTISSVKDWYPMLEKPLLNPPAWIFGPVWTTLFLLMGYALYLVWKDESGKSKRLAYFAFGIQMVLNMLWSIIFFGLHSPGGALIEIVFLWLAILATFVAFAKISKPAAWLLLPYILWVSFAMYLNYSIWMLN
ncbi:MAG: tryptophan-rich sensory protein [Patescibacteria group bacterium]|nr:tryptophan-rich sensory protein [Patescibacteria group bacterium]